MLSQSNFASRIVPGNIEGATSFNFSLGRQVDSLGGSVVFVGALNQGTAQNYALSLWGSSQSRFSPWAPETATINGVADQTNPIYNAAILRLGLLQQRGALDSIMTLPIVVTQAQPADIQFVQDIAWSKVDDQLTAHALMLTASDIKDTSGVGTTAQILAVEGFETEAIFAAVNPAGSANFGPVGSGVAVTQLQTVKVDDCPQTVLVQINVQPGSVDDLPRASALDITSASIKIGNDVLTIANAVDLYYSSRLKRLYVGLQVQGAAGATDGARAVVVGRFVDSKLVFEPIAPDAVFTLQDKIIGATGASSEVSIHKVRTMQTTTGLDYLIVLGNVGAPGTTLQQVYALPLVNAGDAANATQGLLANVLLAPEVFYTGSDAACSSLPQQFSRRSFVVPATQPNQVFTDTSVQSVVGITSLPAGDITDIKVSNDVVFVSVAQADPNQLPGIFYSQALFDAQGAIAAWTPWQRVAGTTDPVYSFVYRSARGNFAWLTGQTALTVDTVKETEWGTGSPDGLESLVSVLGQLFPVENGGIQGFVDLPNNTPGLFDISIQIATGLNKVALIQTGSLVAGTFTPTVGDFATGLQEFTGGEITQNLPVGNSRVVAVSGGALDTIGQIVAATVGTQGTNGYLFVGGACGLAVLSQPDGSGWSTLNALSTNFSGLTAGMRFAAIGSYNFVRKLIFDEGFLYVLTDTQLDRIDLAASNFATGDLAAVTVATLSDIGCAEGGTLLDVVVSNSFALLASSNGLYRVGNGANIQTTSSNTLVDWTDVGIPEGVPVVQQLQPIVSNNLPNGFAKTNNGNVYILDGYAGLNYAQENRYTVQSVVGQPITIRTIEPLPDMKIKDTLTAFNKFNQYVNLINFDGTDNFFARDRRFIREQMLRDELYTLAPYLFDRGEQIPLEIGDASIISGLTRSSASGAWLVTGDFGLRVNE